VAAPGQVPNYRAIVKQSAPAVVGITVEGAHKMSAEEQGLPDGMENDPFFKFFRGMPGFSQRGGQGPQTMPFKGLGSGFIISANGLILTNAHVVREAKDVTVKLSDRREYSAKVLGIDTTTDIAVLKIDAKDLPIVRLGDPKSLEVGDPVLAIGAPYGLEQTATSGIVSAKGRATRAARFSTAPARWSASTPRSIRAAAASRASRSRFRSTLRSRSKNRSSPPARPNTVVSVSPCRT
jgi:serine protease Do